MEAKRFDEHYVVCNDCEHYWDSSCDGVKYIDIKKCNSFKATRRYDIPKQIEAIKKTINVLGGCIILTDVSVILICLRGLGVL